MKTIVWLAGAALLLSFAVAEAAPPSGIQVSPDGKRRMVNKDVGEERWAMTYNVDDATVTGNVFFRDDREPRFVWCERIGDNGDPDPQTVEISLDCFGADSCRDGSCEPEGWQLIAGSLVLPGSFFQPQAVSPCGDPVSSAGAFAGARTAATTQCP